MVIKNQQRRESTSAKNLPQNYFEEIGLGVDFTARDIQQRHKEKGEFALGIGQIPLIIQRPVSKFLPKTTICRPPQLKF